jgi:hypothetical protein
MLKLPSKNWQKVQVKTDGQGRYTLRFISSLNDEGELREIVIEDIAVCLSEGDRVISAQWDTKSVELEICDWEIFKRRLILVNIVIEE